GIHHGRTDAGLPRKAVDGALGHVPRPTGVTADHALSDDLTVLDDNALRVADALTRVVVQADRDVLAVDGKTLQVHHHRVRKAGDAHGPAGISHHPKTRHGLVGVTGRLEGNRAAEHDVFRLLALRHPCRPPRLPLGQAGGAPP